MYKILLLLLMTSLLSAKIYDGVAIVVEDKAITLLDMQKAMTQTHLDAKKVSELLIRKKLEALEIKKRKITVTSDEVYADIKRLAERNHLSVGEFYDAVRNSNGLSSSALQKKIKEKLLHEKLFQAIAMSSLSEPSDDEIAEYFKFHKKELEHPSSFDVTIYTSKSREELETKVHNLMFYSPSVTSHEQVLEYNHISPELASLLSKTKVDTFTPVLPNGQGGFMSFYIKSVKMAKDMDLESIKPQIINAIMSKKREEVLTEYFARLRDNADIRIIRMPK
ncbi:peptidylprolyl isomerase [Sulfurimonas sp.]|uniref:peptidylprolyl isomerase n=1 Tax=Sulfurimonas sp. TaxID=2022749 RepID=UPI00261401A0|nr:peptidylprolyl isomerase [Sulfurimonas sp.]